MTLQAPAEEVTRRSPYMWGSVEAIDESTCEYKTGDDSLDWLAMRVGMLGVDFEVHEPPELIERFELLAGRFGRAASTEYPPHAPGSRSVSSPNRGAAT